MKYLIRLEEAAKLAVAFYLSVQSGFGPLTFFLFLLVPDVSMVGYLINSRWGAYLYNVAHHQGIGIAIATAGYIMHNPTIIFSGLILVAHSSMDRVLGYGLKYEDDFKHTHLGWIGKKK